MTDLNPTADFTHDDLIEITKSSLDRMIKSDIYLSDLPSDIMLEEVLSLIALEHGQSITITVLRDNQPALKVIVPQHSTIIDLKKAIARHFEIYQERMNDKTKISWKYIWKTYHLVYDGLLLDDDQELLNNYGLCNKSILKFAKKTKKERNDI